MIRSLLGSALAITLCGCMLTNYDRAAENAVKTYDSLRRGNVPETLTVAGVLSRCDSSMHNSVCRELARLHYARERAKSYRIPMKENELRTALLDAEKARISLNCLLGFLPEEKINYDTAGAFDVPQELPDVTVFEKAVLLASADRETALNRLKQIRFIHADAVAAYDAVLHTVSPAQRCAAEYLRVISCIQLADAAGTTLANMTEINAAAKRFDAYKSQQFTSR